MGGILQNVDRPLFPQLSYLIQKYANEAEMTEMAETSDLKATHASKQESKEQVINTLKSTTESPTKGSKASRILRMALAAAH